MSIKPGYTRVSEILSFFQSFDHIDPIVLEKKRIIGSNVHHAINCHLQDVWMPLDSIENKYFESWMQWNDQISPLYASIEHRLYDDDMMITGCLDAIITLPYSNDLIIVDYKTSSAENPITWPLQGGFYHMLCTKNNISVSNRILFLKLNRLGKCAKVFEYTFTSKIFRACMEAYEKFRQNASL